jgi:hypothetical protein
MLVPDNTDLGVSRGVTGFCLDETTMGETANTEERVCNQGEELRGAKELQQRGTQMNRYTNENDSKNQKV